MVGIPTNESAGASGNRYVPATEVIQLLTKRNPPANIALMILAGGFNVAVLVTGCNSNIEKKENASENSNKSAINTQVNVSTNEGSSLTNKINLNSSGTLELALDSFMGEWNTTKRLIIPSNYSEEELKERDMVGHKVIIESDFFSDANFQYKNPYYIVSNITDNEFVGENIGTFANSSLSQLNIRNKSTITKLDVYSNESLKFLIETFYQEDENTLITNSNFIAFFGLKRIK